MKVYEEEYLMLKRVLSGFLTAVTAFSITSTAVFADDLDFVKETKAKIEREQAREIVKEEVKVIYPERDYVTSEKVVPISIKAKSAKTITIEVYKTMEVELSSLVEEAITIASHKKEDYKLKALEVAREDMEKKPESKKKEAKEEILEDMNPAEREVVELASERKPVMSITGDVGELGIYNNEIELESGEYEMVISIEDKDGEEKLISRLINVTNENRAEQFIEEYAKVKVISPNLKATTKKIELQK